MPLSELEFRGPNTKSNSGGEVSLCLPEPLGGPTISRKRRSLEKRAVTFPNPPGGVLDVQRLENAMWRLWRRENRKRAWQPWYSALPEEGQKASKQIGSQIDFPQVRQLLHKQDLFNMRNLALHLAQRSSEGSVEAGQSTEIPSTPRSTTSTQLEFQDSTEAGVAHCCDAVGLYPRLRGDSGECFPLWPDQSDAEIDSQPTVDMVHGRLTTVFTMKVQEGTPGGSFRNKFFPRECPKRLRPLRRWSDPEGWPDGKLPGEMDNVVLPPDDNVLLDIETPKLHWLDVQGRLEFDRTVNTTLHAHSVKVWGIFEMGTAEEPIPPGVKAEVVLWGDEQSITVIMVEGLFLVNKVIAVLGQFSAVGSPSVHSQAWTRLATTASEGATELTLRGNQSDWPMGSQIAISATEFPQPPATTETEVRQIASKPVYDAVSDTTTFSLDTNLTFRHFAGVVDSSSENTQWPRPVLAAAVALLDGRSNVVLRTGEADTDHGGELVIAGSSDGRWEGIANVSNIDFVKMGKHLYQAPALKFNFLGGQNNMSSVENCVFSHSQSGAIEANHVSHLRITQNVFHRTFRSAVWLRDTCRHDSIVLHKNIAIETFRHPRENWIRQFGSFFLEVRPGELVGNVAAGSTDTGFILRPQLQTCQKGDAGTPKLQQDAHECAAGSEEEDDEMNEAVAAMTGMFILSGCQGTCNECAQIHGLVAWKNAHAGIITAEQTANVRLDTVLVSDNHIGVTMRFLRPPTDMDNRVYSYNMTVFGSTAASTCAASIDCRAYGEEDTVGETCNSVIGSAYRRASYGKDRQTAWVGDDQARDENWSWKSGPSAATSWGESSWRGAGESWSWRTRSETGSQASWEDSYEVNFVTDERYVEPKEKDQEDRKGKVKVAGAEDESGEKKASGKVSS
eukprot:s5458_g5.t1